MKTIIFKDTDTIDYIEHTVNKAIETLNTNHKKVLEFNSQLTPSVTLYQSFFHSMNENNDKEKNDFLRSKTIEELKVLIKAKSPFFSEQMLVEFYNRMIDFLHRNHVKTINGMTTFREDAQGNTIGKEKNINTISNGVPYFVTQYEGVWEMVNDLVKWDDKRQLFVTDADKMKSLEERLTYYCQNSKQEKVMKLLQQIDKCTKEMNDIKLVSCLLENCFCDHNNRLCITKREKDIIQTF